MGKDVGTAVEYRWNPENLSEVLALPAAVVDKHIKMAGVQQLKVLLWLARKGKGSFQPDACSKALGISPAECSDALQYWLETGILLPAQSPSSSPSRSPETFPASPPTAQSQTPSPAPSEPRPAPRPRPVKPQLAEVLARREQSGEFAYLLDTASARLGRPLSHGDMETLLYLYDTAGLPAEVILMVVAYAAAEGKMNMRYIEKVALNWVDQGIVTIAAAEDHLCRLERRQRAWATVQSLCEMAKAPSSRALDSAEKWLEEWHMDEGLIRLAYDKCVEKTGEFQYKYMDRILERWHLDGIDTPEKAQAQSSGKSAAPAHTSLDLDEYENMVRNYVPVYKKG